jgi:hypothetical protein
MNLPLRKEKSHEAHRKHLSGSRSEDDSAGRQLPRCPPHSMGGQLFSCRTFYPQLLFPPLTISDF